MKFEQDVYFDVAEHAKLWNVSEKYAADEIQNYLKSLGYYYPRENSEHNVNYKSTHYVVNSDDKSTFWAYSCYDTDSGEYNKAIINREVVYNVVIEMTQTPKVEIIVDGAIVTLTKKQVEEAMRKLGGM